jgi:ABC-type multidrug transport system ATPase subunit
MTRRSGGAGTQRQAPPAVSAQDLVKAYGDVVALEVDELEVAAGEAVVLVGHNGSGKSTLLNLIAGTLEATAGQVLIHGDPPDSILARSQRSWMPDTPVLYDDLSVREHLEYTIRMHGGAGDEDVIEDLIDGLGLRGREDDLPSQFSRGLRQKTAAAVALCRPFSVLLGDEPFVGLDASGRTALLDLLDEAHAGGATLVVATHDPVVLERFERGLVLDDGGIIHDGPASGLADFLRDRPLGEQ